MTAKEIEAVGAISTRAQITATRFTNEYHFGDFRGKPTEFLRRWYDAMVYYRLHIAAEASPPAAAPREGLAEWIARLPTEQKDQLILAVCAGSDPHVGSSFIQRLSKTIGVPDT